MNPISPNTENAFKNQTREKNLTMVLTDASSSGIMSSIALLTALWYCKKGKLMIRLQVHNIESKSIPRYKKKPDNTLIYDHIQQLTIQNIYTTQTN